MRKIKLCIDARMIYDSGIGTYIRSILPHLVDEFEITLLGNKKKLTDYLSDIKYKKCITIIEFNASIYTASEQILYPLVVPVCDIFWSPHYNVPYIGVLAKKRVVTVHDINHIVRKESYNYFANKYASIFMKRALSRSDVIFTVSDFSKQEIEKYFFGAKNIKSIYNGIDTEHFVKVTDVKLLEETKEYYKLPEKYLLYVGNVKPHKNIVGLLESFSFFRHQFNYNIPLLMVGKKEGFIQGQKDIDEIMSDLGLVEEKDVFFRSDIHYKSLPSIYSMATVYLFLSLYEGFGLPVLEAQACDCPVIASNMTSLPEVCKQSAIMVDPNDYIEIAYKIDGVLSTEGLRSELVNRGRENVKRFSWKKSGEMHSHYLKELFNV